MRFTIGQRVKRRSDNRIGYIIEAKKGNPPTYRVAFDSAQNPVWVPESALIAADDSLSARLQDPDKWDDPEDYWLYQQALGASASSDDSPGTLRAQRLAVLPHQIVTAARVIQAPTARFILADEVGLGKTIEAGLILQELLERGIGRRVLILTPASLTHQWEFELRTKFNDHFDLMDTVAEKALARKAANPWTLVDRVIASAPWVVRDTGRASNILTAGWDVVIVDEAHHARSHTQLGAVMHGLAHSTPSILLLTASPIQLGYEDLHDLLSLVDPIVPRRWPTREEFRDWFSTRATALRDVFRSLQQSAMMHLQQWNQCSIKERHTTIQRVRSLMGRFRDLDPHYPPLILYPDQDARDLNDEQWLETLSDPAIRRRVLTFMADDPIIPTRRVIRHRKRDLQLLTVPREVKLQDVFYRPSERRLYDFVTNYVYREARHWSGTKAWEPWAFLLVVWQKLLTSSTSALAAAFERRLDRLNRIIGDNEYFADISDDEDTLDKHLSQPIPALNNHAEREFLEEALRLIAAVQAEGPDSKAQRVLDDVRTILAKNPMEKIVIFTQFLKTQSMLLMLMRDTGIRAVPFHGKLTTEEKEAAIIQFRDEGAVLISTESGGEGRNLQFAHIILNFDLPWNPMRIEQRIGRVDRIGQDRPVQIHNYRLFKEFGNPTLDERILTLLHERLDCFQSALGPLDPIIGDDLEKTIRETWLVQGEEAIEALGAQLEVRRKQLWEQAHDSLREVLFMDPRMFDWDVPTADAGSHDHSGSTTLYELMKRFFARYPGKSSGTQVWSQDGDRITIHLPDAFRERHRDLRESYWGTFTRTAAQQHEEWDLFGIGHPLVDAVLHDCQTVGRDDRGTVTARRVEVPDLKGRWVLESTFRFTFAGLEHYETSRCIRIAWPSQNPLSDLENVAIDSAAFKPCPPSQIPSDLWGDIALLNEIAHEHAFQHRADWQKVCHHRQTQRLEGRRAWHRTRFDTDRYILEHRLQEETQWLALNRNSTDPGIRRIFPAREGQVHQLKRDLDALLQRYKEYEKRLDNWQEAEVDMQCVSLALITGM